jgi:predicted CxxxxCH...CXXCH cytochrome family protein
MAHCHTHSVSRNLLTLVALSALLIISGCGDESMSPQGSAGTKAVSAAVSVQPCTPTGAHAAHAAFDCKTCHLVGGVLCFDPNGPAPFKPTTDNPTPPPPAYDATAKTCSNVACHFVPGGTFTYPFQGGDGEVAWNTITYAATNKATPSWISVGAGCSACHNNPPADGNLWHSGNHSGSITSPTNQCQLCHPDATGTNGQGTAITNPALHRNGTVEVQAQFQSYCFGCH